MSARTPDTTLVTALSVLLIAGLWIQLFASLAPTSKIALSDFAGYYRAAALILNGSPEYLYRSEGKDFTNLPVVSLLVAPLALLEYRHAWLLFWWLQVSSFVAAFALLLWGVRRFLPPLTPARAALASAIFVCFAPLLRRSLIQGQTTPMMMLLLAAVWLLCRARWDRTAGLLLGVVCVIKIPPVLLAGLFFLRRRLALALGALLVVAGAVALSWLFFGSEILGQYADRVIWSNFGGSHAAFNNRSLEGVFLRLLTERSLVDWNPTPRPWTVTLCLAGSFAGLAWLLLRRGAWILLWPREAPRDDDPRTGSLELEFALGAALMLLIFPVVWIHYYLLLAVPLALLPFWWLRAGLSWRSWSVVLLAAGTWLASGTEVPGNLEVGARSGEALFRLLQNAQPLGALLLVLGLCAPLAELARRQRADARISRE
ncbi:MAG: DUF2029 domain-containing protein [Deltaproteobacteria bacterium]|nr:DUF2029 domain-containing protein [Deltaproteobacteria bacterium]